VEYTYDLTIDTASQVTRAEPRGQTIKIPFTVYPKTMSMDAYVTPGDDKLKVKTVSLDTKTGKGEVEVTPVGEAYDVKLNIRARNPNDPANGTVIRTHTFNIYYDQIHFIPEFNLRAGSFSYFNPQEGSAGTLHLGDGETQTFSLRVLEPNADIRNITVTFNPGNTQDAGISKDTETDNQELWRITHSADIQAEKNYLVNYKLTYSYAAYAGSYLYPDPPDYYYSEDGTPYPSYSYSPPYPSLDRFFHLLGRVSNIVNADLDIAAFRKYYPSFNVLYEIADGILPAGFPEESFTSYTVEPNSVTTGSSDDPDGPSTNIEGFNVNYKVFTVTYTPISPFFVPQSQIDSYLSRYIYKTARNKEYQIFDKSILQLVLNNDPTITDTRHGSITVSYTRFTGQGAAYTIPVIVEIRNCPAYMK
jgi:hypothetical protein